MACEGVMKGFLVTLNIIFFLLGSATLSIAIWIKVDKQHLLDLTKDVSGADLKQTDIPSLLENAVAVLIAVGAFIFLIGFLGCCGTMSNKRKAGKLFLKIYSSVVLILLILELAGTAVIWLFFGQVETKLKEYLDASLEGRYNGSFTTATSGTGFVYSSGGDAITLAWDTVQLQFGCCGKENGSDYTSRTIYWNNFRDLKLADGTVVAMQKPPTCCAIIGGTKDLIADLRKVSAPQFTLQDELCPRKPADDSVPGCYEEVKDVIEDNSVIFLVAGTVTLFVELLCIVFACCLAKRDHDEVDTQTKH